ncbi:MAG: NAD(P)-binding domain-containing protein, partial [Pseudomonas sagittaria]|nr:NAD(P)-binding domain-containing protein [Pseudomonas sagittaria]
MHIGFLGLGNMGAPMARNLLKAGHQLTVFDLSAAAVASLVEAGATAATSPAALAQADVELIITMLPAAAHVKGVYLGDDGLLANVHPDVLLIDSSTIDPQSAREVAAAARQHGNPMLDAPVSGGTGGAAAGTLTFMVGGEAADFARAQPILAAMGKNIVHCGGTGNGQAA